MDINHNIIFKEITDINQKEIDYINATGKLVDSYEETSYNDIHGYYFELDMSFVDADLLATDLNHMCENNGEEPNWYIWDEDADSDDAEWLN